MLGFVRAPTEAVEVLIAASILAVAVELTRDREERKVSIWRAPWAMALAFGLLHGFGLAGALAEVACRPARFP